MPAEDGKLSQRLREEGSEVVINCHRLKLRASDGKYYSTDAANTKTMFRIIQSIPSKKAEPFKQWGQIHTLNQEQLKGFDYPRL
jgi:DNA-damage-inducible protein D